MTLQGPTLAGLAADLAAGRTTSRTLVEECLARIDAPGMEGGLAYLSVDRDGARAVADAMDGLRKAGAAPSPYAGIPISIKDLFDIAGQVTRAGSRVLANRTPARRDAVSVARLRGAGFVVMGRTNMTEFAFSGLGLNPHYGTPCNPWDAKRIPGGSSSGAAVSVARNMAQIGLGTDTGGSCRIPAAFTGLVGYKPTAARIPLDGALPLSASLDSIGPIGRSVACCAVIDSILAAEPIYDPDGAGIAEVSGLRLGVPEGFLLDDMDAEIGIAFESALTRLSSAGARIVRIAIPELADIPKINAKGGLAAAESLAWHRDLIESDGDSYDPRVLSRIRRGAEQDAADYIRTIAERTALIAAVRRRIGPLDALILPTVPVIPPRFDELESDESYARINGLVLRNPSVINMIDGCALSLPMTQPGAPPAGLMIAGQHGQDRRILTVSAAIERILHSR